ncbi:tropomyosin-2-like [Phaseolus vulgaris]|uniref:tropomyosin-2-like n=1 Tax=Phaseolus vulgaris TaxID=3885 RepID=UPI0035CA78A1
MQAQTLQALETKATTLEEEMRTLGRQNETYQTSLKQAQESKAETERQLAEALELQAGLYTREVALQVQVTGLQELLKADAEIQKDLKDRCREQPDKTERLEGEMATQAKAMDLLRADYDKLQAKIFPNRSYVTLKHEQATREFSANARIRDGTAVTGEKKLEEVVSKLSEAKGQLEEAASSIAALTTKKNAAEASKQKLEAENADLMSVGAEALAGGFELVLEQIQCVLPDLDLSQFSIYHEVVDGKLIPPP